MRLHAFSTQTALALTAALTLGIGMSHAQVLTGSLSGFVYVDANNNGLLAYQNQDHPERVIPGVVINLLKNGTDGVFAQTATDSIGQYTFAGLGAGTYSILQLQPFQYVDGIDTVGAIRNATSNALNPLGSMIGFAAPNTATTASSQFANIVLPENARGDEYNFGERGLLAAYVSKRNLLGTAPQPVFTVQPVYPPPSTLPEPASGVLALVALSAIHQLRRRMASFLA